MHSVTVTASPSARSERSADALAPGTQLDRYEVIELLGEGSMGAVYRARDLDLDREVALKRIKTGHADIQRAEDRLHREAQTMARIEHPAVVRIYNVGIADGALFIAMELARGGTFKAWSRAKPRTWRDIVALFVDAGRGLAAAHRAGIVHRDIKPSNLLVDGDGRAKVSDFGIARVLEDTRHETMDGAVAPEATRTAGVAGTLAYMPPEQLTGGPLDARADQFAFCVALWSMLCGRRPFALGTGEPSTPEQFHRAIVEGRFVADGARHVPRRILAVIRRGLAPDRTARWESMDDLLDALEHAARSRRAWWLAAAASLLVAGAVAFMMRGDAAPVVALPAPCGQHDQLTAVWNTDARRTYLATGADAELAQQDATWFDHYADALDHRYRAACGRSSPAELRCLDDALGDLRAALTRRERPLWPRLRALDHCGATWRERDVGRVVNGESRRSAASTI